MCVCVAIARRHYKRAYPDLKYMLVQFKRLMLHILTSSGTSENSVLKLADIIPRQMSHKLYYDNWFTAVQHRLFWKKMQIHNVATVRSNRLSSHSEVIVNC